MKGLAFILLVLLSCVYISSAAEISEKRLLTNLKENVSNEDEIDKLLLNKVCANIQVHLDKGKAIDAEEYYYLAYKNKIDNDEFNYKNNMLSAYRLINDKTDTFAKLSINVSIIQGFDDEVSIEEQSIVYKDTLGSLTAKEINDNASLIQKYISIMSSKIEDENIQTEVLSNIYSKSAALDSGFAYYVRDTLTIEYAHKGNYAKSIELILKSFWQNEVDPSPFYEARALINTGLIYCELNDYDAAIEYLKKSMNIKIEDKSLDDHTKLYALINLYLIYYDKDDYDSMFNALNLIKEYAGDEIIKKYEHMAYAKYYLKINDLEKAEEHIKLADDLNKVNKEEGYSDFYLYHSINISELNYKRGNINESIQMYENLLEVCESKYNAKKKVLYNLVNIYREIGDYDNSIKYINMLKDTYVEESVMINTNYSDNLVEIRQYEKKMSEIKNKRNRFIIMVAIILVLTFMTVLYFYIKNVKLKKISRIDGLTQIYNRKYFNEVLEKILGGEERFNIIIFDIDNFKHMNDTYGHVFGDKIISGISSSIARILDNKDKIFRYGGEEFVIINYDNDINKTSELCENIRKTVEMLKWEIDISVTVSIGACSSEKGGNNVLEYADECLYHSKNTGKNKYTIR